jgi:hypothetical protein
VSTILEYERLIGGICINEVSDRCRSEATYAGELEVSEDRLPLSNSGRDGTGDKGLWVDMAMAGERAKECLSVRIATRRLANS